MEGRKELFEIKNIKDIKEYKQTLKQEILLQEKGLSDDIDEIKVRWEIFGHREVNDKVVNGINKAAGFISTGAIVVSKVIDIIHEGKKIYNLFNHK
ncbi:MAG: hypothetical protein LBP67_09570 [Bacteroidales bacterium]|jgi:hypothetical protein|nr:hypothetical protein [Bacteroidales bacterium]